MGENTLAQKDESKTYMIFTCGGASYAVDAMIVKEITWLPELTPDKEAPGYVPGVCNIRGKVVPVVDIMKRSGHACRCLSASDKIIVIHTQDHVVAIVVDDVADVWTIDADSLEPPHDYGDRDTQFIESVAKSQGEIIKIINVDMMMDQHWDSDVTQVDSTRHQFKEADEEVRALIKERTRKLATPEASSNDESGLTPLAVVSLHNEFFAIEMDYIREFTTIKNISAIPGCPKHIIGNVNLRGEVVTVMDIAPALNMGMSEDYTFGSKAIVVAVENTVFAILINDVKSVHHLQWDKLKSLPESVRSVSEGLLSGVAVFQDKMIAVIDLKGVLLKGNIIVNQR